MSDLFPQWYCVAALGSAVATVYFVLHFSRKYRAMVEYHPLSVDEWMDSTPTLSDEVYVAALHSLAIRGHEPSGDIPLISAPSPYIDGLKVTYDAGQRGTIPNARKLSLRGKAKANAIIVGTIRMGFGHHRIAHSACSWCLGAGADTYFHDLLNIDSSESQLIKDTEKIYSAGSRLASELGGVVEKIWGAMTLSGGVNVARNSWQLANDISALMDGMPKDVPVIASHSLVAMIAVACGFKHVINLVIDNHAQWFVVVPGAINLVQGPANYFDLLRMGIPSSELRYAGHWVPKDIVDNLEEDCDLRIERCEENEPRRLLVPIGGAGAQRKFVVSLVKALEEKIQQGLIQVILNAADHKHIHKAFETTLDNMDVEYDVVSDFEGLEEMCENPNSIRAPVVLLAFDSYFPSVAATDMLIRVCDVLVCKPSELAFYPIPKLMISRRVGDHEQFSAIRASELGDGTAELRTVEEAMAFLALLTEGDSAMFITMNECIMAAHAAGVYNGCQVAVELAQELSERG
ncbi:unnamed protein product [Chrysoparadoxa australica]